MAKEMMIIFVYDTEMLQNEQDDPSSAILYFHPSWVSDTQKVALCGQLVGTIHCIQSFLAKPKIVSLQSGKFFIQEYGRYLMAVGTDRNIADWLLEHRAVTMASLINFFHEDIQMMAQTYENTAKLTTKLYQLFETYLKHLFLGGNIFSHIPSIKLPKSASNVFLEAIQILQCCQELNYVLGGTLLYHNKVVATQLSSDITKRIVLTDPYRIKCPGEQPTTNFELPLGVQLIQVNISSKEYYRLFEEASRCRSLFQLLSNKNLKKHQNKSVSKEPVMSAMKRDQSLIFTAVPEEGSEIHPTAMIKPLNRPKSLNLKNKTSDFVAEPKKPTTPFHGQTSVCSTPMTDLSRVIHSQPMSICLDPSDETKDVAPLTPRIAKDKPIDFDEIVKNVPYVTVTGTLYDPKQYSSVIDVHASSISESIRPETARQNGRQRKTIADPNYPIFRPDGSIVSHPFYRDYLTKQMELITVEIKEAKAPETRHFDDFDANVNDFVRSMTQVSASPDKIVENIEITHLSNKRSKEARKSLTLPLKSLDGGESASSPIRRHSSGVLLTPLMSKLSNFDDKSSGFCSRDTTPSEYRLFTPTQANLPFSIKNKLKTLNEAQEGTYHKCILFVCGQQDMVVSLLMQEEAAASPDVINKLWDICTENLAQLEKKLHHCLDTYPCGGSQSDSEEYSYLYLDPEWDTIHRGGPWGTAELGALTCLHRDFNESTNLTEILMRGCESVIYGYQCGKSEVFYHQTATSAAGLPTPADAMGNVPMKARRRLERDHSIILL